MKNPKYYRLSKYCKNNCGRDSLAYFVEIIVAAVHSFSQKFPIQKILFLSSSSLSSLFSFFCYFYFKAIQVHYTIFACSIKRIDRGSFHSFKNKLSTFDLKQLAVNNLSPFIIFVFLNQFSHTGRF